MTKKVEKVYREKGPELVICQNLCFFVHIWLLGHILRVLSRKRKEFVEKNAYFTGS